MLVARPACLDCTGWLRDAPAGGEGTRHLAGNIKDAEICCCTVYLWSGPAIAGLLAPELAAVGSEGCVGVQPTAGPQCGIAWCMEQHDEE